MSRRTALRRGGFLITERTEHRSIPLSLLGETPIAALNRFATKRRPWTEVLGCFPQDGRVLWTFDEEETVTLHYRVREHGAGPNDGPAYAYERARRRQEEKI